MVSDFLKRYLQNQQSEIMKNNYLSKTLFLFIIIAGFCSCKKEETVAPIVTSQLTKVAYWNSSTGAEINNIELAYDSKGAVTTITRDNTAFTTTYNSSGKLSLISGTVKGGIVQTYTMEYNTSGQLVRIIYSDGGTTNGYTKTLTYNTTGKVSKITTVYMNTAIASSNIDYTWNGDNIATATVGTYITTYVAFDDKINPYSLADVFSNIYYSGPASKNNVTEIKTLNGSLFNTQKRSYEYNAAGYATSMKLLDGSNEGQKYYYNK